MKVTIIKTQTGWTKSLTATANIADKYRIAVHSLAVSALIQGEERNMNWLNELIEHLAGKRTFSQAKLIEWVAENSPLRYSFKDKKFAYSSKAKNQEYTIENATATAFFDTEDGTPTKKLKSLAQATRAFAQQIARRIMAEEDSVEDYADYPADVKAAIMDQLLKPATIAWVAEYEAQTADNT